MSVQDPNCPHPHLDTHGCRCVSRQLGQREPLAAWLQTAHHQSLRSLKVLQLTPPLLPCCLPPTEGLCQSRPRLHLGYGLQLPGSFGRTLAPLCLLGGQWWLTPPSEKCQTRNLRPCDPGLGRSLEGWSGGVGVAQGACAT